MDNASKALIMAGAILISVAIVGIGIYIFTTANGLTESAVSSIDSLEVSTLNSNILKYCGDNVRGSSAKQLISDVNVWNKQGVYPTKIMMEGSSYVTSTTTGTGTSASTSYKAGSSLTDTARVKVSITEYDSLGYAKKIKIEKAN